MTFTARQVLTAAQLNDLDINTLTTSGDVTVGGTLTATIAAAGSDGQIQYNNGGAFGGASALYYDDVNSRVGIGTTSPTYTLDVDAGADGNILRLKGANDTLNFTVSAGDFSILNSQQSNGIVMYDGTGGVEIWYNGAKTLEIDSGGNKFNGGLIVNGGDYTSTGHVTAQSGGADSGIVLGQTFSTGYVGLRTAGMSESGSEYVIMSNGTNTYVSSGASGVTYLRGPNNSSTYEIAIAGSSITVDGATTFEDDVTVQSRFLFPSGSISSTGYLTFDRGFCTNDFEVSGTLTTNYIKNDNGNFLALEGGDSWNLGTNASGEYVWLAAEGGVVIVSSDANSTVWANRNQIRITPEGGIDQRLKIHGGLETGGPDGGGVIRTWQAGSTYIMFGTAGMASQEYAVLTDGINTFIGAGTGGTTHIRGPNNDSSPQITNNGTNVSITGTCLFTDIDISGTARANEYRADDYGPANDCSFTFISDEDTGVYRVTTNQLGLAAGGSAGIVVASGTCITAAPSTGTTSGYQYVLRNNTYGTLYRYTSTIDVKEQVADFEDAGSIIDALRPVTFIPKFIAGQPTPDDQIDEFDPTVETEAQRLLREADLQYGFIAEEVAQAGDGKLAQYEWTDDGQLKATGWKWPDLIAVLTAEVKSLRSRVATLESAP